MWEPAIDDVELVRRRWVLVVATLAVGCTDRGSPSQDPAGSGVAGAAGGISGSGGAMEGAFGATGGGPSLAGSAQAAGGAKGLAGAAGSAQTAGVSPFDWVGVIGTGQSLSVGCCDSAPISTSQPFQNLKLEDSGPDPKYPLDAGGAPHWAAVPLTEPIREPVPGYGNCSYPPDNCQYPNNIFAKSETPHSGMANQLSASWRARGGDYVSAHSVVGVGGSLLTYIAKGTGSYKAGLSEARVFAQLAKSAGKSYGVGGIVLTHGEADASNPDYASALYTFWQDYNADLVLATGQTRDVVLFASQQSTTAAALTDSSAVQLWRASLEHPGKIVCTGPKYQYTYSDGLHMTAAGYRALGEKYAEVFDIVVNQGLPWKPLGPRKVSRTGAAITIDFDVPNPPLMWDETIAAAHEQDHTAWANGRGFEIEDDAGGEVAIAAVEIQGDSVILTLAQAPAPGVKLRLAYATTADVSGFPNGTALHGQLRDSDELVGYDAEKLLVQVISGSAEVTLSSGAFAGRAGRDLVEATGLPKGTRVVAINADALTLSSPWSGPTGAAELAFHHDQHNYCVHFAVDVP
jgi:hypothetical protein